MRPPPFSALTPGSTLVNIILKADQPTGKLTAGIVADILTRGDHPRGVKVRLQDGRVGRVQRILESGDLPVGGGESRTATTDGSGDGVGVGRGRGRVGREYVAAGGERLNGGEGVVVRGSLMDFVRPVKRKRRRGGNVEGRAEGDRNEGEQMYEDGDLEEDAATGGGDDGTMAAQRLLEKEFPNLDTALVAAILLDHEGDLGAARGILEALR